jgi:radical SAM superfamily enzyme YgiQ (UPF0313 family)
MADFTLLNLNMLYLRYYENVDRELHLPLGPLYLTRAIEDAGFEVDFRDYQLATYEDPFVIENVLDFLEGSADHIGISVMANLLPFAVLLAGAIKERWPGKTVVLGGVGPASVERRILERFPAVDAVAYGECDRTAPELVRALVTHGDLGECPNLFYREDGSVRRTARAPRITDLAHHPYPAYEKTDLSRYNGIGVLTSRGCPFKCSFCSVAPIWNFQPHLRTPEDIVAEMAFVLEKARTNLFLFQDEYLLASPRRAKELSRRIIDSGLDVRWKAFGRVNLVDREAMELMAKAGCVELRFGIESGSDDVLAKVSKGFTVEEATRAVSEAVQIMPGVDTFFIWGFPFESMADFYQTVFLMNSYRMMGARVLPSLLCYLPQTRIYDELDKSRLEFSYEMMPEYMITGHESCTGQGITILPEHEYIYELIVANPDIFPGFYHVDIEGNVRPKMQVLAEFGFYRKLQPHDPVESCGAHSATTRA